MLVRNSKNEELEITGVCGRYEDDIEITDIQYVNRDDEVSDEDVDYVMNNYASDIYDMWYENQVGAAEYLYEGER